MCELLPERSACTGYINVTTDNAAVGGERDLDEAAEILNADDREVDGSRVVGNGLQEREVVVIDVDLVVRVVGRE